MKTATKTTTTKYVVTLNIMKAILASCESSFLFAYKSSLNLYTLRDIILVPENVEYVDAYVDITSEVEGVFNSLYEEFTDSVLDYIDEKDTVVFKGKRECWEWLSKQFKRFLKTYGESYNGELPEGYKEVIEHMSYYTRSAGNISQMDILV